jgi:CheY-like chemotaxis protein
VHIQQSYSPAPRKGEGLWSDEDIKKSLASSNKKVLLVEDNIQNQDLMKEIFKVYKIEYDIANNGKEGFEKAMSYDYACILMDCYMPIMDGYESTLKILEEKPQQPIVGLTASVINGQKKCRDVGMCGFISKPINIQECIQTISRYLK